MLYSNTFSYAGYEIESALDDNNKLYVSFAVIEKTLSFRANSTREKVEAKSFKAFAGEDFQLGKKEENTNTSNSKKAWLPISSFYKLVYWQVTEKNDYAINLVISGFIADFEKVAREAHGQQLNQEQQEYIRKLVRARLEAFKGWTDIIRDRYLTFYGKKPEGWYYGKLIKKANLALFGVSDFGHNRTKNMTEFQQVTIKDFESFLARKAQLNPEWSPEAILDIALKHFTS